jgi:phosphatidylserine/phosphatidylglycerophosphate/cardiolipin synthase-like enzyme
VAQDAISAFDDMWSGADQIHCEDFHPSDDGEWEDTCQEVVAVSEHVPEVLRTYLPPDGNDLAFSIYRTKDYKEADTFIAASLASAQETIDMIQVNFSLEMICMANLVFPEVCTIENSLPWMDALIEAVSENGVKVRAIVETSNSNGLENRVAANVLFTELERRGLRDQVELRFYNGKVHAKSTLIDGHMLIIGSQNMHYSSWGDSGLTEYSLVTDAPEAIREYQALFETKWEQAVPFDEAEFSTSP